MPVEKTIKVAHAENFQSYKILRNTQYYKTFLMNIPDQLYINPVQEGGAKSVPPPVFPLQLLPSTDVEISPKNFLTFSFHPFATRV